jgi:hypothetical protein
VFLLLFATMETRFHGVLPYPFGFIPPFIVGFLSLGTMLAYALTYICVREDRRAQPLV